jgi:hypothetical protein
MTSDEFLKLSNDLQHLASIIPLKWGSVQNNTADSNLNMFKIHTYLELETQIEKFDEGLKNYFR